MLPYAVRSSAEMQSILLALHQNNDFDETLRNPSDRREAAPICVKPRWVLIDQALKDSGWGLLDDRLLLRSNSCNNS